MSWRSYSGLASLGFLALLPLLASGAQKAEASKQAAVHPDRETGVPSQLPDSPAPLQAPNNELPPEKLGDLMMVRKRYRDAIDVYKQALPSLPLLWTKIGVAHHEMKQLNLAQEAYQHAIREDSRFVAAINNLGVAYFDKGDFKRAERQYREALRISQDSAPIYKNLGSALFAGRKDNDGAKAYQKALALDPAILDHAGMNDALLLQRNARDPAKADYYLYKAYSDSGMEEKAQLYLQKAREAGFQVKQYQESKEEGGGFFDWFLNIFR